MNSPVNRAAIDIADSTVRVRLFGGRPAEEIADQFPILPVTHPALPAPGPELMAQAVRLGDQPYDLGRGRHAPRPDGLWLTALVRSVLYQVGTTFHVGDELVLTQPGALDDGHPSGVKTGPAPCKLMVVGKCLGKTEVQTCLPFSGPGSADLWKAWKEVGMPAPGAALPTYMTNLLPFEPPPSIAAQVLPKSLVQDGCHLLWQQFAIARPSVILLLGADAAKAVLGRGVTVASYRGRVTTVSADFRAAPDDPPDPWTASVVVADHPAAVARSSDLYPAFLGSMMTLARTLGYRPNADDVPQDYKAVYTLNDLEREVEASELASARGGYVAFDCEWEGAHPSDAGSYLYTIQWSHAPGHARVAFLRRCGGAPNHELLAPRATELLDRLLRRAPERGARLVAHFAKGDLKWLAAAGINLYDVYVGPPESDTDTGELTYTEGAFDVYVAAHAVEENRIKQLEVMAAHDFGARRYDAPIDEWKVEYCKRHKLRRSELKGYGNIPEETIFPYGAMDADYAGREYLLHNGDPRKGTRGLLDRDRFQQSSRKIFGIRMRAWAAMAEMERYGLLVNKETHKRLSETLIVRREQLLAEIRTVIGWPEFSPSKTRHMRVVLFGERYTSDGLPLSATCQSRYLEPYKATKKSGGRLWGDAHRLLWAAEDERRAELTRNGLPIGPPPIDLPDPAVDKESLINLSRQDGMVQMLLDLSTLSTALKTTFRPPDAVDGDEEETDEEPEETYSKGLMHHVRGDGRVDTMLGLVETGRYSSSRPNLQNVSDSVDEKINRVMGWGEHAPKDSPESKKKFVTRSTFEAQAGWFLADADLKGAEIAAAGWQSDDQLLIEHARRNNLPEDDPDWLDLHSDLGAGAFGINCPLSEFKKKYKPLRVAAKRARFGHYYGASPETIHRQCLLDSPDVTLEQVTRIVAGHDEKYPTLAKYFAGARKRVRTGWLRNGYGGTRRFRPSDSRDLLAAQERAAQNWTCQGLVADHISVALGKVWYYLRLHGLRSRIVLAIHDSIVMECPPDEIAFVADTLLPWAMGYGTPVVPTNYDGVPLRKNRPYFFGVDVKVCRTWGINLSDAVWRAEAAELVGAA